MDIDGEQARTDFVERVFVIVRQIPYGRVTTYGRIAQAVGTPRSARMVGWALHNSPPDISEVAHRVVNRYGFLSGGWSWGHPDVMKALLEDEGVTFLEDEEYTVDLSRHLWEPSERTELSEPDDEKDLPAGQAAPPPTK